MTFLAAERFLDGRQAVALATASLPRPRKVAHAAEFSPYTLPLVGITHAARSVKCRHNVHDFSSVPAMIY